MFWGRKAPERRPRVATDITATRTRVQGTEFLAGRYRLYENSLDNQRATERRLASSALGKVLARAIRLLMESRICVRSKGGSNFSRMDREIGRGEIGEEIGRKKVYTLCWVGNGAE